MRRVCIALTGVVAWAVFGAVNSTALAGPTSYPIGAHVAEKYNIPTSRSIHTVGLRYHGRHGPQYGHHPGYRYRHYYPRYPASYRYHPPVYQYYQYYTPYPYYQYYQPYPYGNRYYSPYGVSVYGRHFGLSIGF